jgi:hypothetical protein
MKKLLAGIVLALSGANCVGYGSYVKSKVSHSETLVGWSAGEGIGFKVGTKSFSQREITAMNDLGEVISKSNNVISSEYNIQGLFARDHHLFKIGHVEGWKLFGRVGQKPKMEMRVSYLQMGIDTTGDVTWRPEIGLGFNCEYLYAHLGADIYVFSNAPEKNGVIFATSVGASF